MIITKIRTLFAHSFASAFAISSKGIGCGQLDLKCLNKFPCTLILKKKTGKFLKNQISLYFFFKIQIFFINYDHVSVVIKKNS